MHMQNNEITVEEWVAYYVKHAKAPHAPLLCMRSQRTVHSLKHAKAYTGHAMGMQGGRMMVRG